MMEDAAGDVEAAAHPTGELLDRFARSIGKTGALERPVHLLGQLGSREPLQPSERVEVLARGEERVDRELLRHDPELLRRAARDHRLIEHANFPAVEPHPSGDGTNQRRLACSVRAEQRQQLALAQLERRAGERLHSSVALHRVGDSQDVHRG